MSVRAVTFDFWNTIVAEAAPGALHGRRRAAWLGVLEDAGHDVEEAVLDRALSESWEELNRHWVVNSSFHARDAAEHAIALLDPPPPPTVRRALVESFLGAAEGAEVRFAGGIEECLRALGRLGIGTAIVCDVGLTPSRLLRRFLESRGLLGAFGAFAFSDEVGVYKPSPEIFRTALDGLGGVGAAEAAHVGDRRRTDVAGALGMGMRAVRYRGVYDDLDEAHPDAPIVLDHHDTLLPSLGIPR